MITMCAVFAAHPTRIVGLHSHPEDAIQAHGRDAFRHECLRREWRQHTTKTEHETLIKEERPDCGGRGLANVVMVEPDLWEPQVRCSFCGYDWGPMRFEARP